jgi:hypothetical protein
MTTTLTVGRTLLAAFAIVASGVASVTAQQPEVGGSPSSASVERIRAALQAQQPITSEATALVFFAPTKPDGFRLGVLTFVPPDAAGQFISIKVPIGELVMRAAHSVAAAQHRRAENAAHAEVMKALADFQAAQPK